MSNNSEVKMTAYEVDFFADTFRSVVLLLDEDMHKLPRCDCRISSNSHWCERGMKIEDCILTLMQQQFGWKLDYKGENTKHRFFHPIRLNLIRKL